jgi:hypothetical protein
MADSKPPRLAGDDRAVLLGLLQYQRDSFVRKVSGVDSVVASSSPVASGNSLLWLANHMADAESTWVLQRFASRPVSVHDADHARTMEEAVARYRRVWNAVDAVVAAARTLDAPCPDFDGGPEINLRWILAHLLEETARHAGHADILRELLDGAVGR